MTRPQRVLPRRRATVPHVLHQQPRRRGDGDHLELPRHYTARPSGNLGGLARRLSPDPAVQVVELARQLRRSGLACPEVGRGVRRWRSRLPKARRRSESELKGGDHFAAFGEATVKATKLFLSLKSDPRTPPKQGLSSGSFSTGSSILLAPNPKDGIKPLRSKWVCTATIRCPDSWRSSASRTWTPLSPR